MTSTLRHFAIAAALTLSACAKEDATKGLPAGDYGLASVDCPSLNYITWQAEALTVHTDGTYTFRQIFWFPKDDENGDACYHSSSGTAAIGTNGLSAKWGNRYFHEVIGDVIIVRGEYLGASCVFAYEPKNTGMSNDVPESQAAGCP